MRQFLVKPMHVSPTNTQYYYLDVYDESEPDLGRTVKRDRLQPEHLDPLDSL